MNEYMNVIDHFGSEQQCRQCMEECAEMIQAVNKNLRYDSSYWRKHLIEELADCLIMFEQIEEIFAIDKRELNKEYQKRKSHILNNYMNIDKL